MIYNEFKYLTTKDYSRPDMISGAQSLLPGEYVYQDDIKVSSGFEDVSKNLYQVISNDTKTEKLVLRVVASEITKKKKIRDVNLTYSQFNLKLLPYIRYPNEKDFKSVTSENNSWDFVHSSVVEYFEDYVKNPNLDTFTFAESKINTKYIFKVIAFRGEKVLVQNVGYIPEKNSPVSLGERHWIHLEDYSFGALSKEDILHFVKNGRVLPSIFDIPNIPQESLFADIVSVLKSGTEKSTFSEFVSLAGYAVGMGAVAKFAGNFVKNLLDYNKTGKYLNKPKYKRLPSSLNGDSMTLITQKHSFAAEMIPDKTREILKGLQTKFPQYTVNSKEYVAQDKVYAVSLDSNYFSGSIEISLDTVEVKFAMKGMAKLFTNKAKTEIEKTLKEIFEVPVVSPETVSTSFEDTVVAETSS